MPSGVTVPTAGVYTFETSGTIGSCGFALGLNTFVTAKRSGGGGVGSNDDTSSATELLTFPGSRCSYVSATMQRGTYTVEVKGGNSSGGAAGFNPGTFRLLVRTGA
jgi:hypothetical protein